MKITRGKLRQMIKESLFKESRYFGMSVQEVLDFFDTFSDNTWIFFDTETMGFTPQDKQLTEIGAVAINPAGWTGDTEVLGTFNEKIKLNPDTVDQLRQDTALSPAERKAMGRSMTSPEILSMTRYGVSGGTYSDEQEVLDGFISFVESFPSPVLVAQNASFDMQFISVRSGGRLGRYPVIDTMRIMQLFLIPMLRVLRDERGDEEAGEILSKMKRRGRYSASMGVVSAAYGVSVDEWHNALADVKMLMSLFQHVIESLRKGADADIRSGQEYAIRQIRRRR
jgi:DNA polymerase III epsilon subunit-like protein